MALIAAVLSWGVVMAASAETRAIGRQGMVATSSPEASAVGAQMLKAGGNAVDAAVAVGFALAVTYPEAGNLGGGGFAVVRAPDGAVVTLDHRERAPFGATQDMFLDAAGPAGFAICRLKAILRPARRVRWMGCWYCTSALASSLGKPC